MLCNALIFKLLQSSTKGIFQIQKNRTILAKKDCRETGIKKVTKNFFLMTFVGVTGLEPATAWSQTRNATNCATPRIEQT